MTMIDPKSDFRLTKDTLYLALTGELWGANCENFQENWLRYNSTVLYIYELDDKNILYINVSEMCNAIRSCLVYDHNIKEIWHQQQCHTL